MLSLCLAPFSLARADTIAAGTVIRDAEIESILHSYIDPIFTAAHLNPKDLRLLLVVSKDVNAFATFNSTIVLFTGFLLKTENVREVIGVLAHEIGHLAGHHLVSLTDAIENAQKQNLLCALAGVTLGILTGRPDIGIFSVMGGGTAAQYSFSSFNRGQEAAADQMAIRYLSTLCWPTDGLGTFLKKLLSQELLRDAQKDPYLRTHPLTQDRVKAVENAYEIACSKPLPAKMTEDYKLLKMKLEAFLLPPLGVLEQYKGTDFLNVYAQVIAYYRLAQTNKALETLDALLRDHAGNPFLWELKGQILYESGKIKESVVAHEKAVSLKPESPLLMLGLAQSLVALEDKKQLTRAESLLEKAVESEPENTSMWHYLSIVYGRQKKMGEMALSLAEKEALDKNWKEVEQQAKRALNYLKPQNRSFLRAQDIKNQATRELNSTTKTETFV